MRFPKIRKEFIDDFKKLKLLLPSPLSKPGHKGLTPK
jgi:hypothetical protein